MKYYPLIRGRQFDLLALREAVQQDQLSPQIIPVLEPVKDLPALVSVAQAFRAAAHPLYIIQNPQVGDYGLLAAPRYVPTLDQWCQPARYFDGQPAPLLIAQTKAQVQTLPKKQLAMVPNEARVRQLAHPQAIYLEDHTPTRERTEDYATVQREFYQYPLRALPDVGFADYPLAVQHFDPHGYPQRAIALHLLYPQGDSLWLQHLVSVNNADYSDPAGKFFEALAPLPAWLAAHPDAGTPAIDALLALLAQHHFPGLGTLRKLQLRHLLSIMGRWLA